MSAALLEREAPDEGVVDGEPVDARSQEMARRVAGNSLWLIAQPLLLNIVSIASNMYIARKLGATDYGAFNLGFAQIALFSPICNLGLRAVAVRAIAEERHRAQEIVGAIYALRILFTLLATLLALGWLALPTYSITTRLIGLAAIVSMVSGSVGMIAVDLFQGFERSRLAAQPLMAGGLVLTGLSVLALLCGTGLPGFVAAYVLGAVIQMALLTRMARREYFPLRPSWDWPAIRGLLRQTRPFALISVMSPAIDPLALDVVVLGARFGDAAVGPYSAAAGLIIRLTMVPHGIADAMYPAVASRYREARAEVEQTLRRCVLYLLLVTVPMALCITAVAPTVLWILFGNEYLGAAGILALASWLLPLSGLHYLAGECLSAVHQQRQVVRISAVGAGILLLLYAVCIPLWGMPGAIIAGLAREIAVVVFCVLAVKQHFDRPLPWRDLGRAALALGVMSVPFLVNAVHYTHWGAILATLAGFALYAATVLALGLVPIPERLRRKGTWERGNV